MQKDILNAISSLTSSHPVEEALSLIGKEFSGRAVFSTSFGLEDQVITHMIFSANIPIRVFTLDTGRLFPETYSVWSRTREIYAKDIAVYSPQTAAVEKLVAEKGPTSFYESLDNRMECCHIRKVEPLQRALKGNVVWITGIRREQSQNRTGLSPVEWDEKNGIVKFHPLFDWSLEEVMKHIRKNNVPYNPLHDKGFPSIGCQPCTRAVKEGEDARAGRWWWEDAGKKECGLHVKN